MAWRDADPVGPRPRYFNHFQSISTNDPQATGPVGLILYSFFSPWKIIITGNWLLFCELSQVDHGFNLAHPLLRRSKLDTKTPQRHLQELEFAERELHQLEKQEGELSAKESMRVTRCESNTAALESVVKRFQLSWRFFLMRWVVPKMTIIFKKLNLVHHNVIQHCQFHLKKTWKYLCPLCPTQI